MAKKKKSGSLKTILLWSGIGVGALVLICGIVLLLAPSYEGKTGFRTLAQMVAYAKSAPEHPPMDNTNLVRPDFTTFYASQKQGFFSRKWRGLKGMVGLGAEDDWSPGYFVDLLNDSLVRHRAHGIKKNIVYRVTPEEGSQFVIWGDIQGAYHSVVRALQKLKELNIIDDNLKIVAPKTYFVFMGDAISRSAYGMQVLSLMLRLQQVNPHKVIYLRGNHEDKKYWHAFGMKSQMKTFLSGIHEKAFVKEVDELFLYFPLGVYLPIPDEKHEFVRLSHLGSARSKKLKEERYAPFLHEKQKESIDRHQIDKKTSDSTPVHIKAVVRSEKKRNDFQEMDGIRLLPPDEGATAWNLLSSPTKVTQEGLKFFHDAFALVKVGAHKVNWSLTLYNQDVRQMNGYSTRSYQFFSGVEMGLDEIAEAQPPKAVVEPAEKVSGEEMDPGATSDARDRGDENKKESTAPDRGDEKGRKGDTQDRGGEKDQEGDVSASSSTSVIPGSREAGSPGIQKPVAPAKEAAKKPAEKQVEKALPRLERGTGKSENLSQTPAQGGGSVQPEPKPVHHTVLPPLPPLQSAPVVAPAPVATVAAPPVVAPPKQFTMQLPTGPYVTITIIPAPGTKIITTTNAPDGNGKHETVIETQTVK